MSSAFKNFFITFAICLLVFGFLGFKFAYPKISEWIDLSDLGSDTSETVSGDTSTDVSGETSAPIINPDDFNENGDVFTAVIMNVDSNNRMLNCVFIDSNAKTGQFIYCTIPTTTRVMNDVGVLMPISDLFLTLSDEAICQVVTVMTGIETKYCLRFDRESVRDVAALIPGASISLNEDIIIVNPKYEDYIPIEGEAYPDDYNLVISNVDGKVLLNERLEDKTKLDWLLEYNPNSDKSEYNWYYNQISKAIIKQFFEQESAMKSSEVMTQIIELCETNLTSDKASEHLATIFSYDDFTRHELIYPSNWETAVSRLRELDGSYK